MKPDGDLTFVRRTSVRHAHWLAVNQQLESGGRRQADARMGAAQVRLGADAAARRHVRYVSRLRETVRDSRPVNVGRGRQPLSAANP